jgi:hypothetical protein
MKEQRDYIQDIAEIRSMMERSSKFVSLSGWAGILAGIYALGGAFTAYSLFGFDPDELFYSTSTLPAIILLAVSVLVLAVITAVYLSRRKAQTKKENIWNATSKRLLIQMVIPLLTGGVVISILLIHGLTGLAAPLMLLFYGLALINAGEFTIPEVKIMGLVQIILGLLSTWHIELGLILWATGFGAVHIVYGVYMHFRYER